ncbi:N-6 DNA Methylase [Chryseobacterium piscicola]|uniref:site-specific DNA-methyltransferase (adenine-specific) n=1 Tax=Chryseobacterium piscicola TaxID=551459 RepID=A0A1N7NNB7_9FLAO|nr:TaqI-like C-terminal specificity domain-containing protein [Chryseobacterium piscicola]PQA90394.1 restriction endonuclease subunit M [Chryseobacterium piscicola]SIS99885.1 N-6 DNA Methylase [Chryseobacterium piscicola]
MFQKTIISKYLKSQNTENLARKWELFKAHFHHPEIQENIRLSKEEQYQGEFLIDLFVNILGYIKNPTPNFNLTTEYKNVKDSKKADGAIVINGKVSSIIELKGTNTTDLSKIEEQAFGYKNNQPDCKYIITSNFEKLRFYIDNAIEHLEFNLFELTFEDFQLLYLCLAFENISADIPAKMKAESLSQEDAITRKLYKDYSVFKRELFHNLTTLNPDYEPIELFKKSQKLLDRLLFLFFGEDRGLLPPNSVRLILEQWNKLRDLDEYVPLYDRFKKYFGYLNVGFKGKQYDVFAYNGGLFKPDDVLDNIVIDDELLYKHSLKLADYDFASEVDVNILGHIFENSLNELDEVKAQLEGQEIDKSKTKRKKDGVFYTPKYITKYIVENTVGKLCEDKKAELAIVEEEYFTDKKRQQKTKIALLKKLDDYREWLHQITIIDPACGSGAFLNEALNFLITEHQYIDELEAKLTGSSIAFTYHSESILENNLFGVDLNEESVEIAKLSLWLRTAEPNRKLNSLNNNIKCGNSLIDDPEVAGDKVFNWEQEFPQIFAKGGFDVVIGNPPYVPTEYISENDKLFLEKVYQSAFGRINLYPIFYEKGLMILNNNGILGYITPYTILKNKYYKQARKFILENSTVKELIDFKGVLVFKDAAVDSIILILKKELQENYNFKQISNIESFENNLYKTEYFNLSELLANDDLSMLITINDKLIKRVSSNSIQLKEIINFNQGIITGGNSKYLTEEKSEITKKVLTGGDFKRYFLNKTEQLIIYDTTKLHRPRKREIFEIDQKILLRQTASYPICMLDTEKHYTLDTVHNGLLIDENYDLRFLLTILNSKLLRFLYESQINEGGKVFAQVKIIYIDPLPIKIVSSLNQQPFIEKADQMISLNKGLEEISAKFQRTCERKFENLNQNKKLQDWYKLSYADFIKELTKQKIKLTLSEEAEWADYFDQEKSKALEIQEKIASTDKEIDHMVYELYGLSEEEIVIVENS